MGDAVEVVRVGGVYGIRPVGRLSSVAKVCPHGFEDLYRVLDYDHTTKRGRVVALDPKTLEEMLHPQGVDLPWITRHNRTSPVWIVSYYTMGQVQSERRDRAAIWEPRWPFVEGEPWAYGKGQPTSREQALGELKAWQDRVNRYFDQLERGSP